MKHEILRNLFFDSFVKQKELHKIENEIHHLERNMPYDSGPASDYVMSMIDKIEEKRIQKEKELNDILDKIKDILK